MVCHKYNAKQEGANHMRTVTQINLAEQKNLIKRKRKRLHMTQKELADAIGLPKYGYQLVRCWENGETIPTAQELRAILDFPETVPFPNNEKGRYRMIDLFAGIGGTRLGFCQTGAVNIVFSSEWDKFAQKTYHANYGEIPVGDITQINEKDVPDNDILVGGFPCVAFSQAGLKKGFGDKRGTLFFDIARILKEKRSKAFLLENVKNLLGHDNGNTFDVIRRTLEDLGYAVFYKVFATKDFGLPQNRERIYIVGFDKHQIANYTDFLFPEPLKTPTRVGDILDNSVDPKYTLSDTLWNGHQRRKIENAKAGKGFGFGLFNANSPYTNTISARYYKDGSEILIEQENANPRRITPREASRLQGFPEEFIIPVSDTQAYKQFGNSVAVPVIHAIAENIVKVLDNYLSLTHNAVLLCLYKIILLSNISAYFYL